MGRLRWTLRRIEEATGVRRETASGYLKQAGIAVREPKPMGEAAQRHWAIDELRIPLLLRRGRSSAAAPLAYVWRSAIKIGEASTGQLAGITASS